MRKQLLFFVATALVLALPLAAAVEEPGHQATAGLTQASLVNALNNGSLNNKQARQLGLLVFSTPFNTLDGHGDGPFDINEWNDTAHGGPIVLATDRPSRAMASSSVSTVSMRKAATNATGSSASGPCLRPSGSAAWAVPSRTPSSCRA